MPSEAAKEQEIVHSYVSKVIELTDENLNNRNKALAESLSKVKISAYTNDEVSRLNNSIRSKLKQSGILAGEGYKYLCNSSREKIELISGDQIIFKNTVRDSRKIPIAYNNEIGKVVKVLPSDASGSGVFVVDIVGNNRRINIEIGEKNQVVSFKYAYAITNHAVQGADIPYKLYSVDKNSGYESFNVGLTRHTVDCEIFASESTLENEVYKSKSLDVEKVKEEYKAISYAKRQEDIPNWKIGLMLLASKRSNLNMSIDYEYSSYNEDLKKRLVLYGYSLEKTRIELQKINSKLEEFNESSNKVFDVKFDDSGQDDTRGLSRFELSVSKHFKVSDKDIIIFDSETVINSPLLYAIEHQNSAKITQQYQQHVTSLKLVSGDKLAWNELSELDKNLVLHSYLSREEQESLSYDVSKKDILENKIIKSSQGYNHIWDEIHASTNKHSSDQPQNISIMQDYLLSKSRVRYAYDERKLLNKELNSKDIQETLIKDIQSEYGVTFNKLTISIESIVRSYKRYENEMSKLTLENNSQDTVDQTQEEDQKDIRKYVGKYLQNIVNEDGVNAISAKKDLFVYDAFARNGVYITGTQEDGNNDTDIHDVNDNTKNIIYPLCSIGSRIKDNLVELEDSKTARAVNARTIINNYSAKGAGLSMPKVIAASNSNYFTITKHANYTEEKVYFQQIHDTTARFEYHYCKVMTILNRAFASSLSMDDTQEMKEACNEYNNYLTASTEYIDQLKISKKEFLNESQELRTNYKNNLSYVREEFREYLSNIYEGGGHKIIGTLEDLISKVSDESKIKDLATVIADNPSMLGENIVVLETGF